MKLKEYIENLQKVLDQYGDLTVICSADDEGNWFNTVDYTPSVCRYDPENRGEAEFLEPEDQSSVNAVCIN